MVKVKICGLMRPRDGFAVSQTQADYAGFVFAKSRRQVTLQQALAIKAQLRPDIETVGVFVHETPAEILKIYKAGAITIAQLHGSSTPVEIRALQQQGLKVIQVFQHQTIDLTSPADFLMVDSGKGSGMTLNWQELPHLARPLILAGGLDPTNVQTAIQVTNCAAVDVSSGVETNGQKDPEKIKQFVRNAKNSERNVVYAKN